MINAKNATITLILDKTEAEYHLKELIKFRAKYLIEDDKEMLKWTNKKEQEFLKAYKKGLGVELDSHDCFSIWFAARERHESIAIKFDGLRDTLLAIEGKNKKED